MWDERVTGYDFGPGHPMDPVRLTLTRGLVSAFGLDEALDVEAAPAAGESTLALVHDADYVAAVRRAGADPAAVRSAPEAFAGYGLGTVDNPAFPGMHEAAALIAGKSVGAA
jgi:acetoin utilization protein AcuC